VAVSADGTDWFLLNASPEIRSQIEAFTALHPRAARHSPLAGILLTNGDLDHCLGLLSLRESHPLTVYASAAVREGFVKDNVLYATLERFEGQVTWRELAPGRELTLTRADGSASGLTVEALSVPGQPPLHLRGRAVPSAGDNVGLIIRERSTDARLTYLSGVAAPTLALEKAIDGADCVFFDGTFWSSDELIRLGLSERRAEDMAHWPVGGPAGSLAQLAKLSARHKLYIHVNNTNPMLLEDSPERAAVTRAGWQVAHDGLEIEI